MSVAYAPCHIEDGLKGKVHGGSIHRKERHVREATHLREWVRGERLELLPPQESLLKALPADILQIQDQN